MKPPKKKFGPKTRPTGKPPAGAVRGPASPEVPAETVRSWRVKVVYTQERGRWESVHAGHPIRYKPPAVYDGRAAVRVDDSEAADIEKARSSVWTRIVAWCDARNIPPEAYVRQCFANIPLKLENPPEPAQLLGEKYLAVWKKTRGKRREIITQALVTQKQTAARHMTIQQSVYGETAEFAQLYVLYEGASLALSPLFRYCLAVGIGGKDMRRLARRLEAEAILQFETSRVLYKNCWADVLPKGFAKLSATVYPYLLAKLWAERRKAEPAEG